MAGAPGAGLRILENPAFGGGGVEEGQIEAVGGGAVDPDRAGVGLEEGRGEAIVPQGSSEGQQGLSKAAQGFFLGGVGPEEGGQKPSVVGAGGLDGEIDQKGQGLPRGEGGKRTVPETEIGRPQKIESENWSCLIGPSSHG